MPLPDAAPRRPLDSGIANAGPEVVDINTKDTVSWMTLAWRKQRRAGLAVWCTVCGNMPMIIVERNGAS